MGSSCFVTLQSTEAFESACCQVGSSVTTVARHFAPDLGAGGGVPSFKAHMGGGLLTLIAEDAPGLEVGQQLCTSIFSYYNM